MRVIVSNAAPTYRLVVAALAISAAYVVTARAGFQVGFAEQVTTVWAPTGISLAALLLWGRRLWPAVWLGAFIANAGTSSPWWTAIAIATGNTLEAVVAVWILTREPAFDARLYRLRDTARLIVFGALATPIISATIGVTALCVAAVHSWESFGDLWAAWWLGDALGALVVAPVITTIVRARTSTTRLGWTNLALVVLGCAAISHLAFGAMLGSTLGEGLLHYIVFPVVVLAAVRFGQPSTSLAILGISAAAIFNTVRGVGPFGEAGMPRSLLLLQSFMAVLAATGLLLAAAMTERLLGQRRRGAAHGVGELLAGATDLEDAAQPMLRRVCENLDWQIGALWIVDDAVDRLRCFTTWSEPGFDAAAFERATREMLFARREGLPGRVWSEGEPVWVPDVARDGNFPRARVAAEADIRGAMAFPIQLRGRIVGVAEFFTRDNCGPDADLLSTMSTVGSQLGQFIGRKRLEAEMAAEQRRTRAILNTALDAVIGMDHRGIVTEFNPAAERMFGHSRDQAIGRQLADLIIPPDLRQQHRDGLKRHLATGEGPFLNRRVETRGYHAAGREFPIEVAIIPVVTDGPPLFTGFVRDLTERKAAEEVIRSSEERFRTLAASNSALTLYEHDRDLRYSWVFPQHPEFPDYNIGKTDGELLPAAEGERLMSLKRRVLESGAGVRDEITVTLPGDVRSYDLMIEPRRDSAGTIIGVSGVAVDITERKRTEQLLRDSEARLRETDRRKDEFLAVLAHELRNPLAPIRTALEVLRLSGDGAETVAQLRPMMERQVGYMVRLIDDLLDVSRISSGKFHLQRQPTLLADLVRGAVEANRAAIQAAGVELDVQLPIETVHLDVDPVRFVQVLSNLLNNAAKFTDPGGRIVIHGHVEGSPEHRELALSVIDSGIGISKDMMPRIFDLFTQADQATTRSHGGLGLGLALAKNIVALHGGRIEAHSDGPGRGSRFTVRTPLAAQTGEAREARAPDAARTDRRVLIVDDNEDSAEALAMLVRIMGGEAVTCSNGLEAIARAATFAPEVIFLDIGMPGIDGYETCRRLREQPRAAKSFIVALTGWGQERDKERAADSGFDAHLTKPADPREIDRLLQAARVPTPD